MTITVFEVFPDNGMNTFNSHWWPEADFLRAERTGELFLLVNNKESVCPDGDWYVMVHRRGHYTWEMTSRDHVSNVLKMAQALMA